MGVKMPPYCDPSRINLMELKDQIGKKLGPKKSARYFRHLSELLSSKLSKREFDKLCVFTIGRENIAMHNRFVLSIFKNACCGEMPPDSSNSHVFSRENGAISWSGASFPRSPRRGRSRKMNTHRSRDQPSFFKPLDNKTELFLQTHQEAVNSGSNLSTKDPLNGYATANSFPASAGSGSLAKIASVEDGEEVEQEKCSMNLVRRNPIRAPLGITFCPISLGSTRKTPESGFQFSTSDVSMVSCLENLELPHTEALKARMEHLAKLEGLHGMSTEIANLLNNGLDVFLKRLIDPCLQLARNRREAKQVANTQVIPSRLVSGFSGSLPHLYSWLGLKECLVKQNEYFVASKLDFQVAMEMNPKLLGEDWRLQLEKIWFRAMAEE
ncbi:hypothetical protein AMTRI_Chr12g235310 [Amborella trichopoda]